jgi:hypothetical protein
MATRLLTGKEERANEQHISIFSAAVTCASDDLACASPALHFPRPSIVFYLLSPSLLPHLVPSADGLNSIGPTREGSDCNLLFASSNWFPVQIHGTRQGLECGRKT